MFIIYKNINAKKKYIVFYNIDININIKNMTIILKQRGIRYNVNFLSIVILIFSFVLRCMKKYLIA